MISRRVKNNSALPLREKIIASNLPLLYHDAGRGGALDWKNTLYFGDNLEVLRANVADESVDLIYLDPPFNSNSNANYNALFKNSCFRFMFAIEWTSK